MRSVDVPSRHVEPGLHVVAGVGAAGIHRAIGAIEEPVPVVAHAEVGGSDDDTEFVGVAIEER